MEFLRHCPGCGRRFHIKLESKKLVKRERMTRKKPMVVTDVAPRGRAWGGGAGGGAPPTFVVQEGVPIIIDIDTFEYTFRCNHCGHEWSEKRVQKSREG